MNNSHVFLALVNSKNVIYKLMCLVLRHFLIARNVKLQSIEGHSGFVYLFFYWLSLLCIFARGSLT